MARWTTFLPILGGEQGLGSPSGLHQQSKALFLTAMQQEAAVSAGSHREEEHRELPAPACRLPAAQPAEPHCTPTPIPNPAPRAGYLFTFYNNKKQDERKAQIDRVNDQVRLLYGPLLACVHATRAAYSAMVRQHSPNGTTQGFQKAIKENPSGPEGAAYR